MTDIGKLWWQLNEPDRFEHAAKSTYDAVVWSLIHNDGWYDDRVYQRIGEFSDHQIADLLGVLKKHRVNPFVVAAIRDLMP